MLLRPKFELHYTRMSDNFPVVPNDLNAAEQYMIQRKEATFRWGTKTLRGGQWNYSPCVLDRTGWYDHCIINYWNPTDNTFELTGKISTWACPMITTSGTIQFSMCTDLPTNAWATSAFHGPSHQPGYVLWWTIKGNLYDMVNNINRKLQERGTAVKTKTALLGKHFFEFQRMTGARSLLTDFIWLIGPVYITCMKVILWVMGFCLKFEITPMP